MSGVLEQMQQAIMGLQHEVAALKTSMAAAVPQTAQLSPAVNMGGFTQQAQAGAAFGGLSMGGATTLGQTQAQAVQNVTDAMIMQLITPLLENPHAKAMLQQQLSEMGLAGLPDAQPHQYAELYQRFSSVANQVVQSQQSQQAAQQPAPSII